MVARVILIIVVAACSASFSRADDVELGNLVLNKTITRIGNEFYEAFSDLWKPPQQLGLMHVEVQEAPSARWGSLLAVSVDGQRYYATRLSNRSRNIEDVAREAVKQVMMSVARQVMAARAADGRSDLYGDGL